MIAHVDADSFFASVIVRSHPDLLGKPVLAVGMGGGCVIAATYEAKAKGVKTGMRLSDARRLVPDAVEMSADFRETGLASAHIESVLRDRCPVIEQMSIDEWFLDLKTMVGGTPKNLNEWGRNIQKDVLTMTALSVSVGIAPSKLLAKMASEYRKPGGVTALEMQNVEAFLRDRPAAAIPGIGRQRQIKADASGWGTAWDIACADDVALVRMCGRPGMEMKRELLGERLSDVSMNIRPPKSISRCRTFRATTDTQILRAHLLKHLEYCTLKMRRWHFGCMELSVWIRTPDFAYRAAHRKLGHICTTVEKIAPLALSALSGLAWHQSRFNQVGMALHGFKSADSEQQSLFEDPARSVHGEKLQEALDSLHARFGRDSITRAAALPVTTGTVKGLEYMTGAC